MSSNRKRIDGVVTRATVEKTVTVTVENSSRHPLYGKVIRSRKNYLAHDEVGCQLGDLVRIVESRPISKRKHWVIEEILHRRTEAEVEAASIEAAIPVIEEIVEEEDMPVVEEAEG
jgi:small subunit ribosomal protein S17